MPDPDVRTRLPGRSHIERRRHKRCRFGGVADPHPEHHDQTDLRFSIRVQPGRAEGGSVRRSVVMSQWRSFPTWKPPSPPMRLSPSVSRSAMLPVLPMPACMPVCAWSAISRSKRTLTVNGTGSISTTTSGVVTYTAPTP